MHKRAYVVCIYYYMTLVLSVVCLVYGCSDLESTEGATIWRHADSAAIVCNYTGETWYLTCLDGEWTGEVGNCTKFGKDGNCSHLSLSE